jgi:hypothetical protein
MSVTPAGNVIPWTPQDPSQHRPSRVAEQQTQHTAPQTRREIQFRESRDRTGLHTARDSLRERHRVFRVQPVDQIDRPTHPPPARDRLVGQPHPEEIFPPADHRELDVRRAVLRSPPPPTPSRFGRRDRTRAYKTGTLRSRRRRSDWRPTSPTRPDPSAAPRRTSPSPRPRSSLTTTSKFPRAPSPFPALPSLSNCPVGVLTLRLKCVAVPPLPSSANVIV